MKQPKKLSWWKALGIGAAGALKLTSNAPAQEPIVLEKPIQPVVQKAPVSVTSKTDYFGKYVYRGLNLSDDPVVQQNILINHKKLTAWLFGNYNVETKQINELDAIFDFTTPINKKGNLLLSLGHGTYTFPGTDIKKTQEVYAGLTLDNPKLLNPSLFLFHDFKDGKGNYVELGASKSIKGINLSAKLGFNDHYYRKASGLTHLELQATKPIKINDKTTLIPSLTYQKALDRQDFDDQSYFGISLEYKFK